MNAQPIPSQQQLADYLGVRPREAGVIRWALWARTQVPNGFYLCSPGQTKSAERMIDRGFLSKAESQISPPSPGFGIVVVLNPENVTAINSAASAKAEGRS